MPVAAKGAGDPAGKFSTTNGASSPPASQAAMQPSPKLPRPAIGSIPRGERLRFIVREIDEMQAVFVRKLIAYKKDQECKSESFADLEDHTYAMFDRFEDYTPWIQYQKEFFLSRAYPIQASNLADIGDAAAGKRCYDLARVVYSNVIKIFGGSVYAASRQRAQVGLAEIRGK